MAIKPSNDGRSARNCLSFAVARPRLPIMSEDRSLSRLLFERPELLLWGLMLWHLSYWILVPMFSYTMLPLDTLELLGWGQEWQLGYYKHPPLGAWLGEGMLWLSGGRLDSLYLLAQIGVLITFLYVWLTARLVLDPQRAVLATVLLEGAYWYTYLTPNFNMNSLQLPVWAGLCYHFLRAFRGAPQHWLWFGVFTALVMLSKYSGLLLIASCGLVLLLTREGRQHLLRPPFWLGVLIGTFLLLPHLWWLTENWRLPVEYLGSFSHAAQSTWQAHIGAPLRFAAVGVISLLFGYVLFALVLSRKGLRRPIDRDTWLILALCLGPLLLTMLYGAFAGSKLKSTWAFPFFNLAGVALFMLLPTRVDARRFARFAWGLLVVALLVGGLHWAYKTQTDRSKTAFDGEQLAEQVTQQWQQRFDSPLPIVIGDHILTAIVSSYSEDRPSMLIRGSFRLSPWLSETDLSRGAALICRVEQVCYREYLRSGETAQILNVDGELFELYLIAPGSP